MKKWCYANKSVMIGNKHYYENEPILILSNKDGENYGILPDGHIGLIDLSNWDIRPVDNDIAIDAVSVVQLLYHTMDISSDMGLYLIDEMKLLAFSLAVLLPNPYNVDSDEKPDYESQLYYLGMRIITNFGCFFPKLNKLIN